MVERKVVISNEIGLHARPASLLVKEASKFRADSVIVKDGNKYNCKSIMNILSMGAKKGDEIVIICEGPDEDKALDSIVNLIEEGLDENE